MRRIQPKLPDELKNHFHSVREVPTRDAMRVDTYSDLVKIMAEVAYQNKDYMIFYRGQHEDYRNKDSKSTFLPSIYRAITSYNQKLISRFDLLNGASKLLTDFFKKEKITGVRDIQRRQLLQWSILQHYEVCPTPLLDFTQSLRVACSFATLDSVHDESFIFAFALPYTTNRISVNSEHELVNLRLLSICPPSALRPFYQEGYLVSTEDITTQFETIDELDFNNRLVAKFVIPNNSTFWEKGFDQIPKEALYPSIDPVLKICEKIKVAAVNTFTTGALGEFLILWGELEEFLINLVRDKHYRDRNILSAINRLKTTGQLSEHQLYNLNRLRSFRNELVHKPKSVNASTLNDYRSILEDVLFDIKRPQM